MVIIFFVFFLIRRYVFWYIFLVVIVLIYFVKYIYEIVNINFEFLKKVFICEEKRKYEDVIFIDEKLFDKGKWFFLNGKMLSLVV